MVAGCGAKMAKFLLFAANFAVFVSIRYDYERYKGWKKAWTLYPRAEVAKVLSAIWITCEIEQLHFQLILCLNTYISR